MERLDYRLTRCTASGRTPSPGGSKRKPAGHRQPWATRHCRELAQARGLKAPEAARAGKAGASAVLASTSQTHSNISFSFFNLMWPIIHLSPKIINRARNENLSHILRFACRRKGPHQQDWPWLPAANQLEGRFRRPPHPHRSLGGCLSREGLSAPAYLQRPAQPSHFGVAQKAVPEASRHQCLLLVPGILAQPAQAFQRKQRTAITQGLLLWLMNPGQLLGPNSTLATQMSAQ